MATLQEWVTQNCTEAEQQEFAESAARQNAMFDAMAEAGEVKSDPDTGTWIFTELHKGHTDDPVWMNFIKRYNAAAQ